ncbi:methyl-accepting chemotaxis protein, partial [Piscinibacter sakaiensis]
MASPPPIPGRLQGRWNRLPIGSRLAAAFGVVLLLTAVLGVFSVIALTRVSAASDEVAMKWLPGVSHLASARAAVLELRELEVKHSRAEDASTMAEYEDKMRAARGRTDEHLGATGRLVDDDEDRTLFGAITKAWPEYLKVHDRVVGFKAPADRADARDISDGAAKMAADDVLAAIDKLSAHGFEESQATAQAAHGLFVQARGWVVGLALLALLCGVAAAATITAQLIRQLGGEPHEAAELARAVAAGDLSTPVRLRAGDSRSLMAQLHEMQQALGRVVATVRSGSEGVATASAEIAQGNNDLSGRTEMQASALEQTTASMGELGSTVTQNADNARAADQLARNASAVATRGGEVVGQVVDTMKGINESSKKIADITGVIDGIAFQTNILALNAAV